METTTRTDYPREKLEAMADAFEASRRQHDVGSRDLFGRKDIHMLAAVEAGEAWDQDTGERARYRREAIETTLRDKRAQLEELKDSMDLAVYAERYSEVSRYAAAIVQLIGIIERLEEELND